MTSPIHPFQASTTVTANFRLQSLTSHLTSFSSNPTIPACLVPSTSFSEMPPITCHVLDTSSGKPASEIPVTLLLLSSPSSSQSSPTAVDLQKTPLATATTNTDGRVSSWSSEFSIQDGQIYQLRFETWEYFKGETFFPYVEVTFAVDRRKDGREHYHVPVLLAPWSYSTYRGS